MVNYLSKFTPRLSELAECLCDLICVHVPYQWGTEHSEAFKSIKQGIVQAPVLKYYDSKKPTVLQTDASAKGLGARLLQCEHPVYFVSKTLSDSQKGYVAIELEALAVSWAGEIPLLPVCYKVCTQNRPEAIGSNIGRKSECNNTMATENSDQNICLWLHSEIPPRWKQPVSRLSLETWRSSR